jgi:hypothetical protein
MQTFRIAISSLFLDEKPIKTFDGSVKIVREVIIEDNGDFINNVTGVYFKTLEKVDPGTDLVITDTPKSNGDIGLRAYKGKLLHIPYDPSSEDWVNHPTIPFSYKFDVQSTVMNNIVTLPPEVFK